ncbi:branched-chain amino acid ABC transporter ATP-binding protein/permease [Paracraurococcus lichenis]|uniref:ATP-binding cassette domain-containing protein n=1 Tax=Paracraurococcus lichenis TaxID=3064888 RepID=A0ABT9E3P2_9PROT|nr:ATP-binding cassette domain-containing protein [Paracraurococcus sp. LOR1-02]MDO9710763.1 ATP-binding cassette domain-containing protein [Paracraurococcus sp. LOR1-02]
MRQAAPPAPHRRAEAVTAVLTLAALAGVIGGPYLLDIYTVSILIRSFLFGCVAVSLAVLWGYAGVLSFGQSAFFAIGAYACGLAFDRLGLSPAVALGALAGGCLVATAAAWLTGWLAFGYGVSPFYVSVVTLVLTIVFVQLIYAGGDLTGSSSGISGFPTFDFSMEAWFQIAGGALVAVTLLCWVLVRSDTGRLLVAIRENEQRCKYLGIATGGVKTLLLVGSAVVAAAAGYAYAAFNNVVAPDLGGFQFGTELVIWVALGGRGTVLGPALAAVLIDFTSALLSGSLPFVWQLLVGAVFVLVILLMPEGLGPGLVALVRRLLIGRRDRATGRGAHLVTAPVHEARGTGHEAAIEIVGVARSYGSLHVLEDITLRGQRGELISLVGPNGAGKTTLIRCISDGRERTAGRVVIRGTEIGRMPPERCVRLGLGRKFQAPNVFDALTVAESLRIARTRHERLSRWRRDHEIRLPEAAMQVVRATGLERELGTEVRHLSHGSKQALELAMVLAMEPDVLLLDEPTAGLTKPERTLIGRILVDLVGNHGLCVLIIEHDLEFVREISSRIVVLHQGRIMLDGGVEEVVSSELVRTIYTGEPQALGEVGPPGTEDRRHRAFPNGSSPS